MEGEQIYTDKQLVISRTGSPGGLSITGAIDFYNAEAVAEAVTAELRAGSDGAAQLSDAITGNGDLHIDLSKLEFTDVAGIRALVRVAENAGDGRRLARRFGQAFEPTQAAAAGAGDGDKLALADRQIDVQQGLDRAARLIELLRDALDLDLYLGFAHQPQPGDRRPQNSTGMAIYRSTGQRRHSAKPRPMIQSRSSAERKSSSSVNCVTTCR